MDTLTIGTIIIVGCVLLKVITWTLICWNDQKESGALKLRRLKLTRHKSHKRRQTDSTRPTFLATSDEAEKVPDIMPDSLSDTDEIQPTIYEPDFEDYRTVQPRALPLVVDHSPPPVEYISLTVDKENIRAQMAMIRKLKDQEGLNF